MTDNVTDRHVFCYAAQGAHRKVNKPLSFSTHCDFVANPFIHDFDMVALLFTKYMHPSREVQRHCEILLHQPSRVMKPSDVEETN